MQPHPDGIEGCKGLNRFSDGGLRDVGFYSWCYEVAARDVREHCSGIGTTEKEKQCAYQRLAEFKDYALREVHTFCVAVSDLDDRRQCIEEAGAEYLAHTGALIGVWNSIIDAVEDHPDVKAAYRAMAECIVDAGYKAPGVGKLLPWQQLDDSKVDVSPYRAEGATGPLSEAEARLLRVTDQCGREEGLYLAQDEAWQEEIRRIFQSDTPERIKPLKEEGIIDILDEPGPALFLTNRYFVSR